MRGFALPAQRSLGSNQLDVGEEVFPREFITSATVPLTSGTMRLSYFTCRKTETTSAVRVYSGSTAAGATPTVCMVGLWLVDPDDGVPALVAGTASDPTMFAAQYTSYTRNWVTPYEKIAGQRLVLGVLVQSGAAMPNLTGGSFAISEEPGQAPRLSGAYGTNLSDLPATLPANPSNGNVRPYGVLLP